MAIDIFFICADEFQRSSLDSFWTLRGIPHDKNRLTKRRGFLLNTAGICQNHVAAGHKVVKIQYVQRLDNMNALVIAKNFICRLANQRIHVNGIDCFHIRMLIHDPPYRPEHMPHGITKVFTAVCRDQDQTAA